MVHLVHHVSNISVAEQLQYFESISYIGIFIAVVLSGHVIPVPEDIIMIIVGYIAAVHVVHLSLAIAVSIVAIVLADFGLYYLSFHGSKFAAAFGKRIKTNILSWYMGHMKERTFRVVFLSRFVPGLRVVNPIVAGFVKIPPFTFLFYSFCSAVIYVPIMVLVGFFLHSKIIPLITVVESTRHVLFTIFIVAVGITILLVAKKKFFT